VHPRCTRPLHTRHTLRAPRAPRAPRALHSRIAQQNGGVVRAARCRGVRQVCGQLEEGRGYDEECGDQRARCHEAAHLQPRHEA
jgi:hypothetical protein